MFSTDEEPVSQLIKLGAFLAYYHTKKTLKYSSNTTDVFI
jgi:hypothetical protein